MINLLESNHIALRKKSIPVENGKNLSELISNMFEIIYSKESAVGLAAPQIGQNIRLFITYVTETNEKRQRVFINPTIIKKFGSVKIETEGCLSLPDIILKVGRRDKILIEYFDQNWIRHKEIFSGFLARVIQHEQDHLNGKLIIDYV